MPNKITNGTKCGADCPFLCIYGHMAECRKYDEALNRTTMQSGVDRCDACMRDGMNEDKILLNEQEGGM